MILQGAPRRGAASPHLIRLGEHPQHEADDGGVQHGGGVEAQPGEVHGDLHAKVVADIVWKHENTEKDDDDVTALMPEAVTQNQESGVPLT